MGFLGGIVKGAIRSGVKGLKRGVGKVVKGVKSTMPKIVRGIKSGVNRFQNFLKGTPKPQGVVKETIIKKGTRPIAKIAGKFDESLIKIKPIQEISRKPFVKQTLTKAQRLANAKSAIKSGKAIKNLF